MRRFYLERYEAQGAVACLHCSFLYTDTYGRDYMFNDPDYLQEHIDRHHAKGHKCVCDTGEAVRWLRMRRVTDALRRAR